MRRCTDCLYNIVEDTKLSQCDLFKLESWSVEWQLKLNTNKCEVMRARRPDYKLMDKTLKVVNERKALGIQVNSNLSRNLLANKCANKANRVLGFLKWTVGPRIPKIFSKPYISLVPPIMYTAYPSEVRI